MDRSSEDRALSPAVGTRRPRLLEVLRPGLITDTSDDDPGGIATYGQTGARFGYAPDRPPARSARRNGGPSALPGSPWKPRRSTDRWSSPPGSAWS